MTGLLRVDGVWPQPIILSAGWYRARARPWNELVIDPMVRLERGGPEFLISVVRHLGRLGADVAYSPALFSTTTRVWRRAGFSEHASLEIMERALSAESAVSDHDVTLHVEPDWAPIVAIDRLSFEGFWGMSETGLVDAFETNKTSVVLTVGDPEPVGYAMLGAQWGVAYLHRIAVQPGFDGKGLGATLLRSAFQWAYRVGARTMVLNVRSDNDRAIRLYERSGFARTGSQLQVLRFNAAGMLN